jgi:hypothetical protein
MEIGTKRFLNFYKIYFVNAIIALYLYCSQITVLSDLLLIKVT